MGSTMDPLGTVRRRLVAQRLAGDRFDEVGQVVALVGGGTGAAVRRG